MRKTNRFVALLMALILVFSSAMSTAVFANEDVVGTEFEATVGKLKAVGIMEGYPDGTFKPDGEITRAEFAKIAVAALGLADAAEISRGTTRFPDVPANHWATGFINVAVNRGLIVGYPNGTFQPSGKLTNAEAVTILVRLVGLGPVVDKQGTWPANYIGAASNEGILKGVNVASSTHALRGLTAKMLMNTLDVQKWGATGYDNDGSVSYGKLWDGDNNALTLLNDNLGITEIEGRLLAIDDEEVTIDNKDYDYVGAAADEEWLFLNEVEAWQNEDNDIIYVVATSDQMFDAVKDIDGDELTLVDADEDYDFANSVTVYINGDKSTLSSLAAKYDYAKVVLNDDGDVAAISVFDWTSFVVVEEVVGDNLKAFGEELDVEDYTIVSEGKTLALTDLEEGDIFFYNSTAEYAEVFNSTVTGPITRIFEDRIRVEGDDYTRVNPNLAMATKYMTEDLEVKSIDTNTVLKDVAEAMEDEGDVTVFVDRFGDMVYLTGELDGLAVTSTFSLVTETSKAFLDRNTEKWTFDIINATGTEVKYDVKSSDVYGANSIFRTNADAAKNWHTAAWSSGTPSANVTTKLVLEVKIDADGDIDEVSELTPHVLPNTSIFKTSSNYYLGRLISSSVPVYLIEDFTTDVDDIDVTTYGELDFDNIIGKNTDTVFYEKDGKIVAITVGDSTRVEETTDHVTITTSDFVKVAGKNIYYLDLIIDGAKTELETKENPTGNAAVAKGTFLDVKIDDDNGKLTSVVAVTDARVVTPGAIAITSLANREFTIGGGSTLRLGTDSVVVDATDSYKVVSLSTLKNGDTVRALKVATTGTYVDILVRTDKAPTGTTPVVGTTTITGAYLVTTGSNLTVNIATGLTPSEYIFVVENSAGTLVATATIANAVEIITLASPTDLSAAITSSGNYTVKVVKTSDGTVIATKSILFNI